MNNKQRTLLHFIMFTEEGDKEFTGICYELSLVMTDSDPDRLQKNLSKSAMEYVEVICKNNFDDKLLNQSKLLPKKYIELFNIFSKAYNFDSKNDYHVKNTDLKDLYQARAFVAPAYA